MFFLLLLNVQLSFAQNIEKKQTLNFSETTLKQLFTIIEKKWDVVFVYNSAEVNDKQLISFNTQNSDLDATLAALANIVSFDYRISEYYVFLTLSKKNQQTADLKSVLISGKVIDEFKLPVQGVYVLNTENSLKAVTDENGNFRFSRTPTDTVFVFRMLGYYTQKSSVSSSNTLNIILKSNSYLLNDLLVVGYGSIKAKELTGSVTSLPQYLLNNTIGGDIGAGIQGSVSGVYATNDRYRIRGISSINSAADPLVVVDGVPQSLTLKDLNPDDIESIEFLKDAASGAIYGSRASNGVILVTTKAGDFNSATKLSINLKTGLNFLINKPEFLKGNTLLQVIDDAYFNRYPEKKALPDTDPNKFFPFSSDYINFNGFNRDWVNNYLSGQPNGTDWLDAVKQPMQYHDLRFSLQGGQSQNKFIFSLSYRINEDFIKDKSTQRITLMLKNDYIINRNIKAGVSSNFVVNLWNNSTFVGANSLFARSSLLPVYAPNGSGDLFDARNINARKGSNPLYRMTETWDDNIDLNGILTAYFDMQIADNLTFRSDWSFTPGTRRYRYFQSKDFYREDEAIDPTKSGIILFARTLNYGLNVNNILNYKYDFSSKEKLKIMLGNNIQSNNSDYNVARFEGFPTDYFEITNANTEKVYTRQSSGMDGYRFVSFFNRTQYAYNDKWYFEVNARADGTSRFKPKNRWGFFPGVGLSWLASSEKFVKKYKHIDYLKFRTSYGYVGNAEVGNFPYESRVVNWAEYAGSPGFVFDRIANPDVSWEKQLQFNTGLNISLFQNKIAATFDWYFKRSDDLLINYNIGTFQGYFNTEVTVNTGSMNNRGFDFNISTINLNSVFKWKTEMNISSFSTEITKLSSQQEYIERGINRVYEGYQMGLFFLPLWAGVDPNTGHELIYEVTGPENNKQKTGNTLDAESLTNAEFRTHRVLITDKSPYPKLYGGINNIFSYKNWEFSFLLSYSIGNWIYHSGMRQNSYIATYDIQNKLSSLSNYWTPENNQSQIPLLYNSQMAGRDNTRFLKDGSYLRLRNVLINYTLPQYIAKKIHSNGISLQLQAQNLLTFSKFKNGDPEISAGNAGADANLSPGNLGLNSGIATINFGLRIHF
jgi:TonB-linked SusC/RagA family outer membrane protein